MAYIEEVLKSNPASYQPMDDAASPLVDKTGNGYNMTRAYGTNYGWLYRNFPMTAGSDGCFRSYTQGWDQQVPGITPVTDIDAPFTREFWFHLSKPDIVSGGSISFDYGQRAIHNTGFWLTGGLLTFGIGGEDGPYGLDSERLVPGARVFWEVPDWNLAYHIAGVYNGNSISLYVNGEMVASRNVPDFVRDVNNAAVRVQAVTGADSSLYIEHHATYARALSGEEIMAHYKAGTAYHDYETFFANDGADVIDIDDRDHIPLHEHEFTDWSAPESFRNVRIGPTGVSLPTQTPAEVQLMNEEPYRQLVPAADSDFPYYSVANWQVSGAAVNGDGAGLLSSTYFVSRSYGYRVVKADAGPSVIRVFNSQPVTAGQTYRFMINANCNRNHRQSVVWKNSGGSTISTTYGTSTAYSGTATFSNLLSMPVRAPAGAVTAEFGVETTAADGVLSDYLWVDKFTLHRDLFYSTTADDGVFIYNGQGVRIPNASALLSAGYSGIQGNFYIDTSVHNDSAQHTMWELKAPDGQTSFTLRINTSNTLELLFRYWNPVTLAYGTLSATGPTSTTLGTGWRSFYVVIENDVATLYNASTGTSYVMNNTSPVPLAIGPDWKMTIGNTEDYDTPWNSKLKYINLRSIPETALTFSDALGDYTLKLSTTAFAPYGSTAVSQKGFVTYRVPVTNGLIAGSRITFSPATQGTASVDTTLGPNVCVRTSTDGTTWSSRLYTTDSIPSFGNGVTTNNSSIWVRVDLSSDMSDIYPVSINKIKLELWETLKVLGNYNGAELLIAGTNPRFGDKDLHPSSHYNYNGFCTNSDTALYMGSQSISSLTSIDGSGTVPSANKAYRSIAMMFRIDGVATNDYLFYHDEAGTIYSVYWNGSGYVFTGFSNVYTYASNEQRGNMTSGYIIPQWSWVYMVMVAPANMIPASGDLTRFNFMTRSQANIANTIGGTLKFVALYPQALTLAQANKNFDVLRSINAATHQDVASAVATEIVPPSMVTGDWAFRPITALEETDSAS
jgi:hypothetical protein